MHLETKGCFSKTCCWASFCVSAYGKSAKIGHTQRKADKQMRYYGLFI